MAQDDDVQQAVLAGLAWEPSMTEAHPGMSATADQRSHHGPGRAARDEREQRHHHLLTSRRVGA